MREILQINNLNYQKYHEFNLTINNEKFISIIGSNKCGKTTLLKVISGIIPTSDVVKCNNIALNRNDVNNYIKQLGIVFPVKKESFLFENVYDEMSYPLKNLGYCNSYIKRQINKILDLFSLNIKDKKISELSVNEQQQLLFCISLLHKPKVLLIDDVFSFLDTKTSTKIINILKGIKSLTIINFASNLNHIHDSDYIYIIEDGKLKLEGTAEFIMSDIKTLTRLGLEIPFTINLINKFKELGLIKKDYDKLEDLVNEVWK